MIYIYKYGLFIAVALETVERAASNTTFEIEIARRTTLGNSEKEEPNQKRENKANR